MFSDRILTSIPINQAITEFQPTIIINAIGKVGKPNVDWCEDHREETFQSNVMVPIMLREACKKREIFWVHISSGCVYYSHHENQVYSEDNEPNFYGSFYGRTKINIERILKEFGVLQLRPRMPFDEYPHPRNLITKLVNYKRVIDVPNSITHVHDFLRIMEVLMVKRETGIWNVVNKNPITHPEILEMYQEIVDKDFQYEVVDLDKFNSEVKARRSNCVLSVEKLEKYGIPIPEVHDVMEECLKRYEVNAQKN
jgi:dTDP-4-dehydrorhamnose reductase